jgi:hypothetical protein
LLEILCHEQEKLIQRTTYDLLVYVHL